jgi:hypothetical protein
VKQPTPEELMDELFETTSYDEYPADFMEQTEAEVEQDEEEA